MGKNVLIVFAHQSHSSFNAALKEAAVEAFKKQGCKVMVSDLYELKFNPTATKNDIKGEVKNPDNFSYGDETGLAWKEGKLSNDIMEEQKKIKAADLIVFQFPLYWYSVPAILKGWFDRVLTQGFAYTFETLHDNGPFKNKKAMLSFTTGGLKSAYTPKGLNGDINIVLWPIQYGVLHFCGFQVLPPQISWTPKLSSPEARAAMLNSWRIRLDGIWTEKPLSFVPINSFDLTLNGGFMLKEEVVKSQEGNSNGLTVGQHMGKCIPPNNQTGQSQ
ncbi:NAD(P)H dehydrogenase [quinone] 1 isoform X1 [Polypterus senegalus]|uniref:NAD(P)H dehydrogenase [quinone] 1 isoform X1 n=2 Tax=Polypterus senegalus TaxID=55291 RepID=UPI0019639373|nr:NAD(P)H dehydrogenase [quinone] 1 isoform X1 [Polypterus senegalus]